MQIKKERLIELPDDLLLKYLSAEELAEFKQSNSGIYSVTFYADKLEEGKCCDTTENGCCGSETAEVEKTACCGTASNTTAIGCC